MSIRALTLSVWAAVRKAQDEIKESGSNASLIPFILKQNIDVSIVKYYLNCPYAPTHGTFVQLPLIDEL